MSTDLLIAFGTLGTLVVLAGTFLRNWYVSHPQINVSALTQTRYREHLPTSVFLVGRLHLEPRTPVPTSLTEYSVELDQPQPLSATGGHDDPFWRVSLDYRTSDGFVRVRGHLPIPSGRPTELELNLLFYEVEKVQGKPVRGHLTLRFMHGKKKKVRLDMLAKTIDTP